MVNIEDMSKVAEPEPSYKPQKQTLLLKYQIPVEHLEYAYIEKCKNAKELEQILHILKSGEEGYYPHLMTEVEKRLLEIKPSSKFLRSTHPGVSIQELDREEQEFLTHDLDCWIQDVKLKDGELENRKADQNTIANCDIRKSSEVSFVTETKSKARRISSTDYISWDKYDADTEILKMDLEDENIKKNIDKNVQNSPQKRMYIMCIYI